MKCVFEKRAKKNYEKKRLINLIKASIKRGKIVL